MAEGALPDQESADLCLLSANAFRALAFQGSAQIIESLVGNRPTVLICDDLHHADESSLELLAHVAELTTRLPLWLILSRNTSAMPRMRARAERLTLTGRQTRIEIGLISEDAARDQPQRDLKGVAHDQQTDAASSCGARHRQPGRIAP